MDQTTEQTAQPDVTQTTTTLTTEQPTETTAALTTPEAPTVDFQSLIPEEYREEKSLQNFNKMDDFVKSYLHSQKLVGLDKIAVPNKHATDEDWKEVYKKLGSPETADAYKYSLPEDHQVPEDTLKSFSEEAVKLGLLPNQADGIMKYYNEVINQGLNDQNIKAEEARKISEQELRQEFGPTFDNKITGAKNLATATLGADFLNNTMLADGSKLGDNIQIVKAFANLSEKLSEDDIVKGDTPDYMTTNEITKQIASLQQKGSAYWDKKHPAHAIAVEEVASLIRKKNNEEDA
tara:strand:+ start:412 stop:1287 length:876 start_codon:yes stop_codon:yes gene_type:complete